MSTASRPNTREASLGGLAHLLLEQAQAAADLSDGAESVQAALARLAGQAGLGPDTRALDVLLGWAQMRQHAQARVAHAIRSSVSRGDVASIPDDPLGNSWSHLAEVLFERAHRRVRVSRAQVLAYDFVGTSDGQPWVVRLCHELDTHMGPQGLAEESRGPQPADALAVLDPRVQPAVVEWRTTRARRASAVEASVAVRMSVSQWLNGLVDAHLSELATPLSPEVPGDGVRHSGSHGPDDQGT